MKQRITATNCSNVSIVGRRGPRTVLLIGLLAAFVVAPVHAIPVVEVGPSMVNQLLTQINTYLAHLEAVGEYTKEAKRWDDQFKQYQQQLVKVQAQLRTVGMPDSQSLVKVPPSYMVAQTCGSDGGVIQQLTSMVSLTDDASVRAQQKQICTNIRLMKNRKYNDSVDYLSSTVPSMKKMLEEVYQVRSRSNEQGNVQGADSESLRTANELEASGLEWQTRMLAYDAYIASMEENQRILAREVLKGSSANKLSRSLVQTAALKLALDN